MLNTVVTITLYDTDDGTIIDDAFKEIRELEALLSAYDKSSDISTLNRNAGVEPTAISPQAFELLQTSVAYGELSMGLLDITAGPLIDLWNIAPPNGHIATEEELEAILPLINYSYLELDDNNKTAYLPQAGMKANLGAVAKGYVVDQVRDFLSTRGVTSALINAGGNILAIGDKGDNQPFKIGIQDPQSDRGEYLGILSIKDQSVVTSGDYERYFEVDGVRYHHILNPYNGFPSNNSLKSVTILSEKSTDGDALATIALLMGLEEGKRLINGLDGYEAIFVTKQNEIFSTPQIEDQFKLTNTDYKIMK